MSQMESEIPRSTDVAVHASLKHYLSISSVLVYVQKGFITYLGGTSFALGLMQAG